MTVERLPRFRPPDGIPVGRVALVSVHTSPLDQPGTGDGGGLNVYVLEVARRLGRRGVEVDIFTRATSPAHTDPVEIDPGVTVHPIVAGPLEPLRKDELPNHLCAFALALQRHETAGRHDIVHAHYWLSGWVGRRLAGRWDVPLVQTFHTLAVLKNATLAPGDEPESPLRVAAEARIARDADQIAVLTCGEARLLHRSFGTSGDRMVVVPAGVDIDLFTPTPTALDRDVVADLPPGDGPLLLFVGRLQPLKGPDVAIRTLAAVRQHHPEARLLVVGGPSGNGVGRSGPDELRQLAAELGVADAVGIVPARPQPALAALYRAADVVIVPSRSETFGLVALEAQACGTPVVAAEVGGLTAVVHDGGTLVAGHDPADHAAAVSAYLDDADLARRTGAAGVAHASTSSWDRTVDRLLRVYGEATRPRDVAQTAS